MQAQIRVSVDAKQQRDLELQLGNCRHQTYTTRSRPAIDRQHTCLERPSWACRPAGRWQEHVLSSSSPASSKASGSTQAMTSPHLKAVIFDVRIHPVAVHIRARYNTDLKSHRNLLPTLDWRRGLPQPSHRDCEIRTRARNTSQLYQLFHVCLCPWLVSTLVQRGRTN